MSNYTVDICALNNSINHPLKSLEIRKPQEWIIKFETNELAYNLNTKIIPLRDYSIIVYPRNNAIREFHASVKLETSISVKYRFEMEINVMQFL